MYTLGKFVKSSKIHQINFPLEGAALRIYSKDIEFFDSWKIHDAVKHVRDISKDFDVCLTVGRGSTIAYLAGLNYIIWFGGSDIRPPPFLKKSRLPYLKTPIYDYNVFERRFYKKMIENAVACVTGGTELAEILGKYRNNMIRIDRTPVDLTNFDPTIEPIELEKKKFTFFSPERFGIEKGFDLLWKALPLCKSEFEILQVDWMDQRNDEEIKINTELLENKPSQVKIIPLIPKEEMSKYYVFADAVIGDLRSGDQGGVEREACFFSKPIISTCGEKNTTFLDGKEVSRPFLPKSNDPKEIADIIDKIVLDKEFRDKLARDEHDFGVELADPIKSAREFEDLFEKTYKHYPSIKQQIPRFQLFFRLYFFLITNRLYWKKILKIIGK